MSASDADASLPLRFIGTQAFLPALLAHIRNITTTQSLPLDYVLFQSILLCLIAGEKHLILRTAEEDIGLTVKLVVWTLSCVFDIPTHKLRIRVPSAAGLSSTTTSAGPSKPSKFKSAASDPAAFLQALFLHGGSSSLNSNETSQDEYDDESAKHHHHRHPGKRNKYRLHHPQTPEYTRSHSVPNNLVNIGQAHGPLPPPVPRMTSPESLLMGSSIAQQQHPQRDYNNTTSAAPSPILRPKPLYPSLSPYGVNIHLPHAYTDPLPRPRSTHNYHHHRRTPSGVSTAGASSQVSNNEVGGPPQLPRAVVLSGLEDASEGVQRTFGRVLSEKRVVLAGRGGRGQEGGAAEDGGAEEVWALPEGFFAVYVCPWSATERPAVHKSLLDKFAMSTNVSVPPHIRRDFHLLPFSQAPKPLSAQRYSQQSNASSFPSPKLFFSHSNPGTPSPAQALALPPQSSHTPPPSATTTTVLSGSTSMHRRASSHSSHSHHSYYTHHSHTQAQRHSHYSLSHQSHFLANPRTPAPLFSYPPLPLTFLKTLHTVAAQHTRIAPALQMYMADIFSATRHHSRLDGTLLGRAALKDAEALVRAGRVVGVDLTGMELLRPTEELGGLEGGDERRSDGADDEDEDEDYSSALDISIHNEPLISVQVPSVASSSVAAVPQPAMTQAVRGIGTLDVSEVNMARIVPRVISHRVRVRSAPEEEVLASALFGATFRPPVGGIGVTSGVKVEATEETAKGKERNLKREVEMSVKAMLVKILAEV